MLEAEEDQLEVLLLLRQLVALVEVEQAEFMEHLKEQLEVLI
jgi:hypothetical protein